MPSRSHSSDRLLARDAAPLVRERLDQPVLSRLHRWFLHPRGGAGGLAFLHAAPVLDTALRAVGRAGLAPAVPPARVPRVHGPTLDRGPFVCFGFGFAAAATVRAVREEGSPFLAELDLDAVLQELARTPLPASLLPAGEGAIPPPALLTAELIRQDPALSLVIRAGVELVTPQAGQRGVRHPLATLRFLGFMGMVGAGALVPALPEHRPGGFPILFGGSHPWSGGPPADASGPPGEPSPDEAGAGKA